MNKKILSGTFWLALGNIFSRILGFIYLIPWLIMMGPYKNQLNAQAIFNASYTPYALLISIGTAGLPSAVAKMISELNTQNRFKDSVYIFKISIIIMTLMGILSGAILYFLAPVIAQNTPVQSTKDATFAIRILVSSLIILPPMSMIRGWFQGNNDMKRYAISQLIEQLARVIFILVSTFIIINIINVNYVIAVYSSVFGAFIGAVFSIVYLLTVIKNDRKIYFQENKIKEIKKSEKPKKLILYLWISSIPFVLVGSYISISQFIDQVFFKQVLLELNNFNSGVVNYLYIVSSANPSKITTAIIAIVIAISETSLPILSSLRSKKDKIGIQKSISDNYQLISYFLLPVIIISISSAAPIYNILFSNDEIGTYFLIQNIIQSMFVGLAINVLTILQALNKSKKAIKYMLIGLVIKLILQFPLIFLAKADGAISSTTIASLIILILGYSYIDKLYKVPLINIISIIRINLYFFIINITYLIFIIKKLQNLNKFQSIIYIFIYSMVSIFIYILLSNVTKVSIKIFGKKINLSNIKNLLT